MNERRLSLCPRWWGPSFKLGGGSTWPGKRSGFRCLLWRVHCRASPFLWAHLENGLRNDDSPASCLLPRMGVSRDESEQRYSGLAIVLTIGMIKQTVYLFYSHLCIRMSRRALFLGAGKRGTLCRVRNWPWEGNKGFFVVEENAGIFELLFSHRISCHFKLVLLRSEWPGMAVELELQHERLG